MTLNLHNRVMIAEAQVARLRAEARADRANTVTLAQECDRLRAELAARNGCETCDGERQFNRAENAEAAIARVRELCWECRLDGIELVLIPEIIAAIERNEK